MEIHNEPHSVNVRYVATIVVGGDLEGQTTRTHEFSRDRPHAPTEGVYRRIFPNDSELTRPIEDCENPEVLVASVFHALTAHEDAWVKAKTPHRNNSCDSTMFIVDQLEDQKTEKGLHGILNDGDLCKHERDLALEKTQSSRSDTWAFMSGIYLQYPRKPYRLSDDLESFIHVITFCCLRFHLHNKTAIRLCELHKSGKAPKNVELRGINCNNKPLSRYVANYYDEYNPGRPYGRSTVDWGGTSKTEFARAGLLFWSFADSDVSDPLKSLVRNLRRMLKAHYAAIDFRALEARYSASGEGSTMPFSTIDEGVSNVSEETTDKHGALSTDSSTRKPTPGKDLNSHLRIMSILRSALSGFRDARGQGLNPKDKTPDQFLGLREWHDGSP